MMQPISAAWAYDFSSISYKSGVHREQPGQQLHMGSERSRHLGDSPKNEDLVPGRYAKTKAAALSATFGSTW